MKRRALYRLIVTSLYLYICWFHSSDGDVCHLRITSSTLAAFLADSCLRVLQELETAFSGSLIFHLINGFFDEAEQVVDVLCADEGSLLMLVEVEVCVENLDQEIEILWLGHANLRRLERLA